MPIRGHTLLTVVLGATLFAGCAAGSSSSGARAAQLEDWDGAVAVYRQAVEEDPGRADARIALARATLAAARHHLDAARRLEAEGALTEALAEYGTALDYDPSTSATRDAMARIQRQLQAQTTPGLAASEPR